MCPFELHRYYFIHMIFSFIHSFIYLFIYLFIVYLFIYLFIYLFKRFMHIPYSWLQIVLSVVMHYNSNSGHEHLTNIS